MRIRQLLVRSLSISTAAGLLASAATAATLNPLLTFGGGDGWRAPVEVLPGDAADSDAGNDGFYDFLDDTDGNPNLERGIAYNPTNNNVLLLSRFGDPDTVKGLRILDGSTGVDKGFVDFTNADVSGGTFSRNMIAAADDGAIYMANLTTDASSSPFNIYRWADETTAAPTLVYSGAPLAGARLGDTFDVIGSGTDTRLVAGYGSNPAVAGNNSFAIFDTTDGINFTATHVDVASNPPEGGDFRLGITFQDNDTVIGKQGTNARVVDVSGGTGTLVESFDTDGATLRAMDVATIDGRPILAIMEASNASDGRARLFIYDLSDNSLPLAERKIAESSNLPAGTFQMPNGNGTGQVRFGPIDGRTAIIYGLSTNNGIQAFELTIDPAQADNADFDDDDLVDGADFLTWQRNFPINDDSATLADGDATADGNVTETDLAVWQSQFGTAGGAAAIAAAAVPEPAAIVYLAIGSLIALLPSRGRQPMA